METKAIIKQLEKALQCKEDKELRLRIEVLVDMLKEIPEPLVPPVSLPSASPSSQGQTPPLPYYYGTDTPKLPVKPTVTMSDGKVKMIKPNNTGKQKKINGAGAIIDNTEQITYLRPPNT